MLLSRLHSFRPTVRSTSSFTQPLYRPLRFLYEGSRPDALRIASTKQLKVMKDRTRVQGRASHPEERSKKRKTDTFQTEGSNEEVLEFEVAELLRRGSPSNAAQESPNDGQTPHTVGDRGSRSLPERFAEIQLEILELSSTGEGLALSKSGDHVYTVPFSVPGDTVLAKVVHQVRGRPYSGAEFVRVIKPSPKRDDAGIGCKYFSACSGCQLQMLPYGEQLAHKKTVIEKAYRNFSGLDSSPLPPIDDTIASPMQYGYRTKLTPHFDGPGRKGRPGAVRAFTEVPAIGFTRKGWSKVMDIESCPIGTDVVQKGLTRERERVARDIAKYKNGATILIRETTSRLPKSGDRTSEDRKAENRVSQQHSSQVTDGKPPRPFIRTEHSTYIEEKTYTSDMNGSSVEYIDDWKFTNTAGAFFQNNNSILPTFTAYIRDRANSSLSKHSKSPPLKYLLDAYCGSGLFAITLSSLFTASLGIDIDPKSISAARVNAVDNDLTNIGFIEADASALFADVPFPPDQTLLVIDPPRKGASEDFLSQLLHFGPERVAYVSCNVHTQARDVGFLVRGDGKWKYEIESLRGFDFFPQTGHVEGVAFLNRKPLATPASRDT